MPPARREWDTPEVVTLVGVKNTLTWPPRGWHAMSPERKRQVFDYGAMHLDVGCDGYPVTDGHALPVRYNFLVLPGASRQEKTSPTSLMLFYNYEVTRLVAETNSGDPHLLAMFEAAESTRDKSLDKYLEQIDQANVGLRLSK